MGNEAKNLWVELDLRLGDSEKARKILRACRRAGACLLRQETGRIWAIWLADQAGCRAAEQAADLAGEASGGLRRVRAEDPREIWSKPQADVLAHNLSLAPAWMGLAPAEGRLIIDPLTAFGAGDHPSTRLNLMLLAGLLDAGAAPLPAGWLADLGCGSGILALGMALLSGRSVLAVDPDPAAWRATERNRALNPGPGRLVRFVLGDHQVLGGPFGLLTANLPAGIQLGAVTALVGSLAPAGRLVLSGFRREQEGMVIQAFAELGLLEIERKQELDWVGLVLARD